MGYRKIEKEKYFSEYEKFIITQYFELIKICQEKQIEITLKYEKFTFITDDLDKEIKSILDYYKPRIANYEKIISEILIKKPQRGHFLKKNEGGGRIGISFLRLYFSSI